MSVNTWQAPNTWEDGGVSFSTTETRSVRVDSSTVSVSEIINLATTEIRSSRIDVSSLISAIPGSAEFTTTEVRSSRLDSSILSIPQNLLLSTTETRSARVDNSTLNVPVVITINPRNIIQVKRKNNIIRVR